MSPWLGYGFCSLICVSPSLEVLAAGSLHFQPCAGHRSFSGDSSLGFCGGKADEEVCGLHFAAGICPACASAVPVNPQSIQHQHLPNVGGGFCFSCHTTKILVR